VGRSEHMNPAVSKEEVLRVMDTLPPERISELLDFALFLKSRSGGEEPRTGERSARTVSARRLRGVAGLVRWGGDALKDTESAFE
jgi:hypothetical protein